MGLYKKIYTAMKKSPLLRGMAAYSITWPTSCLVQQLMEGKSIDQFDWARCARFGFYGSCYVAPTLYSWLTVANVMWPGSTIRAGMIKAVVEQFTYSPLAMCSFFFMMSLLEKKQLNESIEEVIAKFWPTYKVGALVWPVIGMINFCVIPPRNRVPFISCCSLVWTAFLAYMKQLDKSLIEEQKIPIKDNIETYTKIIKLPKLSLNVV